MTSFATSAASANLTRLALVLESTFGTTPTSAGFTILRATSESLGLDTETVSSQEIRSDRAIPDVIRTSIQVGGSIDIELSWGGANDILFEGAMHNGTFPSEGSANSGTTFTFDAPSSGVQRVNDSGSGFSGSDWEPPAWVRISGAGDSENNGVFKISALDASDGYIDIVNPNGVADASAGESVTITPLSFLTPGTSFRAYSIEKNYTDLSSIYERNTGCAVNGMSLSIPVNGIVTGSFDFLGANSYTTVSGGTPTYAAASTTDIQNSIDNVVALYLKLGSTWSVQSFTQLDFELQNNLRSRLVAGTLGPISIGLGSTGITGTLQAYLSDSSLISEYISFNEAAMAIVLVDGDGNYYGFDFPAIKFTNGRRVAGGINTDVIADLTFTSKLSSAESIMFGIVRDAA